MSFMRTFKRKFNTENHEKNRLIYNRFVGDDYRM